MSISQSAAEALRDGEWTWLFDDYLRATVVITDDPAESQTPIAEGLTPEQATFMVAEHNKTVAAMRDNWGKDERPFVSISPGKLSGDPAVGHTRVPVQVIVNLVLEQGVPQTAAEYHLARADVLTACWYAARYGKRSWRKTWGAWADANEDAMWRGAWHEVRDA